ncbi:MAG TPA: MarR family transcriptional regulator [Planctomycetota bacterium]|nr:MarR family transcriptional regulator [Planctomycetota bacterium]
MAIRLLRRLRAEDRASELSGPRLSALSVVVFGGPVSLSALAEAEQVRLPTISRLARSLEQMGLVERVANTADRRVQRLRATARGKALLQEGRRRRVERLARELAALAPEDLAEVGRAARTLARLFGGPRPAR